MCKRIVSIERADGEIIAHDIPLDDYFLRHGGNADRLLCEAAADLLEVAQYADLILSDFTPEKLRNLGLGVLFQKARSAIAKATSKGDAGFQDSLELLESAIASATEGAVTPEPTKTITVRIEGGLVQDVIGVPAGYELRVEDYDGDDTSHPAWNADKGCFLTIYDGGNV